MEHHRKPRVYRNRKDHFTKWNDYELRDRFRVSKEVVLFVFEEIHAQFPQKLKEPHALTAAEVVLLTSRFFATIAMLQVVRDFFGIDKSTAGRTVYKLACEIARLRNR
nr:unnamed protein product [Callosobruchus analis]CAI5833773.1 unnamed protein product [Callosobruchus analis]